MTATSATFRSMSDVIFAPAEEPQTKKPQYPVFCGRCQTWMVRPDRLPYKLRETIGGRIQLIEIPDLSVLQCQSCGHLEGFTEETSYQIQEALRKAQAQSFSNVIWYGCCGYSLVSEETCPGCGQVIG